MISETELRTVIRLTRWKEHLPFVIPLSILGAMLAVELGETLTSTLLSVTLANILAVSFAFMINEIEDAEDDARDPKRRLKNPISTKQLKKERAYKISFSVAFISLCLYLTGGLWTFLAGGVTLGLAQLYSWKTVRLKAWPVVDIVSHALMLSGLLALTTFLIYTRDFLAVWPVFLFITLFSAYGQLYNQLRDFKADKMAGLLNTSILVGKKQTRILMYCVLVLALLGFGLAIYQRLFPFWLFVPVLFALPIAAATRSKQDIRGNEVADVTATIHTGVLIIANIVMIAWLLSTFSG